MLENKKDNGNDPFSTGLDSPVLNADLEEQTSENVKYNLGHGK